MRNKSVLTLLAAMAATQTFASFSITVVVDDSFGRYLQPDASTSVDADYDYQFGVFDLAAFNALSEQDKNNFTVVSGLFSTNAGQTLDFDAVGDISATTDFGSPFADLAGTPTPATGDALYALVFNALNTDIFGLFSSADWLVPSDLNDTVMAPLQIDNALVGSISGSNGVLANSVPEPSTYALLAGVMTLGLVAYRRRRS